MKEKSCTSVEVDLGRLDLRHAHTRIARPKHVEMIASSIDRFDQISPVLIIPEDEHLVLIHGFVRLAAIRKLGRDTIRAYIQEISEVTALYHLLADTQERQWEAVEQAWIIKDLKERLGCTLTEIARGIGYDTSWVSRRLSHRGAPRGYSPLSGHRERLYLCCGPCPGPLGARQQAPCPKARGTSG